MSKGLERVLPSSGVCGVASYEVFPRALLDELRINVLDPCPRSHGSLGAGVVPSLHNRLRGQRQLRANFREAVAIVLAAPYPGHRD